MRILLCEYANLSENSAGFHAHTRAECFVNRYPGIDESGHLIILGNSMSHCDNLDDSKLLGSY